MEKTSKKIDINSIIEEAISRLPNGHKRLSNARYNLAVSLNLFSQDFHVNEIWPELDEKDEFPDIAKEYFEEMQIISDIVGERDFFPIKQEVPNDGLLTNDLKRLYSYHSMVCRIWSLCAFPIRKRGNSVYLIDVERCYGGKPSIQCIYEEDFFRNLPVLICRKQNEYNSLLKKYLFWKNIALILIALGLLTGGIFLFFVI